MSFYKLRLPGPAAATALVLLLSAPRPAFSAVTEAVRVGEAKGVPEDFPRFIVPGFEAEMSALRDMFWLHYQPAGPLIPLWDDWMPISTLWPAVGTGPELEGMRKRWAAALASRVMSSEGYVVTMQHDGPAHADGWPFPQWQKHGGVGWHFRGTGVPGYDPKPATPEGWQLRAAEPLGIDERGWVLELTQPHATARTPWFDLPATYAPWLHLNWWAENLQGANCYVEWTTTEHPEFSPERRAYFTAATQQGEPHTYMPFGGNDGKLVTVQGEVRTMIPVYRHPEWKGNITGLRLAFENTGAGRVTIKSFHSAFDTRHTVNNLNFVRAVYHCFVWTRNTDLLRNQMGRMRAALRFMMREFETQKHNCIYNTWPGHEGRSGVQLAADGRKQVLTGQGIPSNYWDLLPFGGEDALVTLYYYDSLLKVAELEEGITAHPEWGITDRAGAFNAAELRQHAQAVRVYGQKRFWNLATGRFGTVDLDSVMHDYGWTSLNNEAVYYDFATREQARSIRDWISGRRTVAGDTSMGPDIYHFQFGPRASTLRNIDYYYWGWPNPETNAWGTRLQDGGAVLGFSYHDLMCRLKVDGPDDAWGRLKEVIAWFRDTQAEGGYRRYYELEKARGAAQGGKDPGAVGVDMEFFESVLVPQVMLYGFMGFEPKADGFNLHPRLPKDWPELRITRIHLHDVVLDLTARRNGSIRIQADRRSDLPMAVGLPQGKWRTDAPGATVFNSSVRLRVAPEAVELLPEGGHTEL